MQPAFSPGFIAIGVGIHSMASTECAGRGGRCAPGPQTAPLLRLIHPLLAEPSSTTTQLIIYRIAAQGCISP